MTTFILFTTLAVFFIMGMPIAFGLGLASLCAIFTVSGLTPILMVQKLFSANDSFPLMAIPFFILAGNIMTRGGISGRLVDLAAYLVARLPGGLAMVAVLGSMFFGAISGSPVSTVAAVGGVLIPSMVEKGYPRDFCGAVQAAAGPLGAMIPPSIALIVYGVCTSNSISALFVATAIPGVLMGLALMVTAGFLAHRKGFTGGSDMGDASGLKLFREASWALLMPLIILGGIYGGIFTPTEAAVIAVVYGLLVGMLIYRELKPRMLVDVLVDAAIGTAMIMIIIDFSSVFSWFLTAQRIPQLVAESVLAITQNPLLVILAINIMMLIVGTFMDASPAIIILAPVFLPLALKLGYDPIHFGIIMCMNLLVGLATPPVGVTLFMASRISGAKVDAIVKEIWPFLIVMCLMLIVINLFPQLSLWLLQILNR